MVFRRNTNCSADKGQKSRAPAADKMKESCYQAGACRKIQSSVLHNDIFPNIRGGRSLPSKLLIIRALAVFSARILFTTTTVVTFAFCYALASFTTLAVFALTVWIITFSHDKSPYTLNLI